MSKSEQHVFIYLFILQPENPGPSFKIRTDIRGKFYCSLCFTSKFAVSAPCLAGSEEEAKNLAALEVSCCITPAL